MIIYISLSIRVEAERDSFCSHLKMIRKPLRLYDELLNEAQWKRDSSSAQTLRRSEKGSNEVRVTT